MLMSIKGFYCEGVRGSKAYGAAAHVSWRLPAPEVLFLLQIALRIRDAHRLRSHDFVGEAILQHSMLMDAGLVRESVAPDDGLIRLHRNTSDFLEQLTRRIKFLTGDAGLIRIAIGTHS